MNNIAFFTAVKFQDEGKTLGQSILENVDNYFYLSGMKAHVITNGGQEVVLSSTNSSSLARIGKIASYFTLIVPLALLTLKAILRSSHTFTLINVQGKLEEGIDISDETISKIKELAPKIFKIDKSEKRIEWLSSGNNLVFKLQGVSELVFKIEKQNLSLPDPSSVKTTQRFANMIRAKEVCLANNLSHLIVPNAKKFCVGIEGKEFTFIAEKRIDIEYDVSKQESFFSTFKNELNETMRQLATFIAKTGFCDVIQRNIPIITETPEYKGPRRIALVDLEHMGDPLKGFVGHEGGLIPGLIQCATSEKQLELIIKEAKKQGVEIKDARLLKNRRVEQLHTDDQLPLFHSNKGITNGREPIQVNLESLGLDLNQEGVIKGYVEENGKYKWRDKKVTMRNVADDLIEEINARILDKPDEATVKGKRCIYLNMREEPFNQYMRLGIKDGKAIRSPAEQTLLWVRKIICALEEKGYIFKLLEEDDHSYTIQA